MLYYNYLSAQFLTLLPTRTSRVRLPRAPRAYQGERMLAALAALLLLDAILIDDEPIFEPVEWSLWQTWLLFMFGFAWIGENLITSRYGAYTGRDRRVWYSWYKSFWLIDAYFIACIGAAALFVIVPFYYEITYRAAFMYQWWYSFTALFFWGQALLGCAALVILNIAHASLPFSSWRRIFFFVLLVLVLLAYAHFWQWLSALWAFFADVSWYAHARPADMIQFSHEPARWGWGIAARDHQSYHHTPTIFWYRADGPYAASILLFVFMQAWTLFFVLLFLVTLLRVIWTTRDVSYTYFTYTSTAIRQYLYFNSFFFIFIALSITGAYVTFAPELAFFNQYFTTAPIAQHLLHLRFCV